MLCCLPLLLLPQILFFYISASPSKPYHASHWFISPSLFCMSLTPYLRRKRTKKEKTQEHKLKRLEKKLQKKDGAQKARTEVVTQEQLNETHYKITKGNLFPFSLIKHLFLFSPCFSFFFPSYFLIYVVEYRRVVPYDFNFEVHVKGRWVGKQILDVFTKEFSHLSRSEYVRHSLSFSHTSSSLLLIVLANSPSGSQNKKRRH